MSIRTTKRNKFKISFSNDEEFERIYEDIFKRNEYPFKTTKETPFIIDCGSHIGLSVLYFKKLYPNAKIVAFEPNPLTFKLLQKNIFQNKLRDVKLINVAVFDKNGNIDFYVDKNTENPWGWGDSAVINKWYSVDTAKTIKVKAITLSQFIKPKVDLLKLDIEGVEERVLRSIEDKLKNIKEIMIEFHGSSTNPKNDSSRRLTFLRKNGFVYRISQDWQFIPEEKIKRDDPYWLSIYAKK